MAVHPNMYFERIIDVNTGKASERLYSKSEIENIELAIAAVEIEKRELETASKRKASIFEAIALQTGFTAEEIKQALNA